MFFLGKKKIETLVNEKMPGIFRSELRKWAARPENFDACVSAFEQGKRRAATAEERKWVRDALNQMASQ